MTSTFYTKDFHNRDFYLTPTEMGMCYVHGGKLADYVTLTCVFNLQRFTGLFLRSLYVSLLHDLENWFHFQRPPSNTGKLPATHV